MQRNQRHSHDNHNYTLISALLTAWCQPREPRNNSYRASNANFARFSNPPASSAVRHAYLIERVVNYIRHGSRSARLVHDAPGDCKTDHERGEQGFIDSSIRMRISRIQFSRRNIKMRVRGIADLSFIQQEPRTSNEPAMRWQTVSQVCLSLNCHWDKTRPKTRGRSGRSAMDGFAPRVNSLIARPIMTGSGCVQPARKLWRAVTIQIIM